jgi:hypothetical protein
MHTRLKKGKETAAVLTVLCEPIEFVGVINAIIRAGLVEYTMLPQKVEYEVSQRQRFGILAVSFQLH